jgi:hypothetical protein
LTLQGGHADAIYSLAWSADGNRIATGSADKTVTIWDPKAGKVLKMLKGHSDTVRGCAWTPVESYDGTPLLASAGGGTVALWNPTSPSSHPLLTEASLHAPGKELECVHVSPNGRYLATGARDGLVNLCSLPELTKADLAEGPRAPTHQEWRARIRHDEEAEFAKILQRRAPPKKEPDPGVAAADADAFEPGKELLKRWKARDERATQAVPDAALDAGAADMIPEGGLASLFDTGRAAASAAAAAAATPAEPPKPTIGKWRQQQMEREAAAQAAALAAVTATTQASPPKVQAAVSPAANQSREEKATTGWSKHVKLTIAPPPPPQVAEAKAVPAWKQQLQRPPQPEVPIPPPTPAAPKKLAIADGASLMRRLKEKTDTEAYTAVAEPGREPVRPKQAEIKQVTMEELMAKPRIAVKIRTNAPYGELGSARPS